MIDHLEPFSPSDHVCPQAIIKEEIREDVIPPAMVRSHRVLPFLDNSMEGVLGNLEDPSVFLQTRNEEGAYLKGCRITPPSRRWGMNPLVETRNFSKKPTRGQLDNRLTNLFAKDQRMDDGVLYVGHLGIVCCLR